MPRKPVKSMARDASSDFSPPPNDIQTPIEAPTITPKGKKRKRVSGANSVPTPSAKVVTEVDTTVVNGTERATKKKIKVEKDNGTLVKTEEDLTSTPRSSRIRKAVTYTEEPVEEKADIDAIPSSTKKPRNKKLKTEETATTTDPASPPAKKSKIKKVKDEPDSTSLDPSAGPPSTTPATPKPKRRTKAELQAAREAAMIPAASRTANHAYHIGAHVSSSGGVHNAILGAHHIGGNAFALFLKSQRKWTNPPLAPDVTAHFLSRCTSHGYDAGKHVVPHGSYLVNLAHTDPERTKQAYDAFLDDLQRCEKLGIGLYNFHPGNVQGVSRKEAIAHLAGNLNRAHKETEGVVTLLENMAAIGGNVIGCKFEELGEVIELVDDKSRVGVCLDTCHAYAAGYDVSDERGLRSVLDELDGKVGLRYLRALHLNDSKAPLGSGRDLHANIGTGFIGLKGFHAIMNEERLVGLPMVLETPTEMLDDEGNAIKDKEGLMSLEQKSVWAGEIKLLESLTGMDIESDEFTTMETKLAAKGRKERARIQDQVDRRGEKKSKAKGTKKGKKKDEQTSDEEDVEDE
ncbi:DNA-(apurinic or apyrimidinic site) lyase 1-like protein [Elsinoe fawcettii]|nr:DNA-(apurinic or apyrimidinic site) lyase 1-like protein [Elsinoe fawcettii]